MSEKQTKVSRGTENIPAETAAKGGHNESLSKDAKAPAVPPKKLDDGPNVGEAGEFLPRAYKTGRGNIRIDR